MLRNILRQRTPVQCISHFLCKMRWSVYIAIVIIHLFTLPLFAARYAGDFIEIGSGVRALGMGGAFTALADDGSAIYWNSSGISQLKRIEVGVMRSILYGGLAYYDHLTYCQPLPNDVTIGLNWTRLSIPDVPVFDEKHLIGTTIDQRVTYPDLHLPGKPDDTFTATDDLIQFAFSKHIRYDLNLGWIFFELPIDFHFGGTVKYIKRSIKDFTGTGTGFDLSLLSKNDLSKWFDTRWLGELGIGLNFQDISNTSITWDTISRHSDEVVLKTKFGFAYTQQLPPLRSSFVIATDADYHVYGNFRRYGVEYRYEDIVSLRMGYDDTNISSGLSFRVYDINLDYAFVTNTLGNTHRIGLRLHF